MSILDNITCVNDIKKLNISELEELSNELRAKIISTVNKNGGHLSSNLGIVETTLAIYYVFDLPNDKLIFDVGHQCYAHKILSGRKNEFGSIREDGGISGFPNKDESEFDPMTTGHAGTSISASLGYCMARDNLKKDYTVINLVGDGSLVNGLNLEALTSSDKKPNKFIVILNDNGMSISKNGNGLYRIISKKTAKKSYIKKKKFVKKVFGQSIITKFLGKCVGFLKRILNKQNYIEKFGFKYVGVENGNDLKQMIKTLKVVKQASEDKAVFLHIKTTKGKGLELAEEYSDKYHGVGRGLNSSSGSFSVEVGNVIDRLIEHDNRIVAITAGMKDGTGLNTVEQNHPQNFLDVGIAEEYAITLSAGMAAGGLKPICVIYSTFLQRGYDQIIHDVALQNLPVVFCLDRAGVVGEDGKTHQGVFDLSFLNHIPNMTILAPCSKQEIKGALELALSLNSPVAIRYPKNDEGLDVGADFSLSWKNIKEGKGSVILAVGPKMCKTALKFAENTDIAVYSANTVKPLDKKVLDSIKGRRIITMEENSEIGGFGSSVSNYLNDSGNVKILGIKDSFVKHSSIEAQLELNGLSEKELSKFIKTEKE